MFEERNISKVTRINVFDYLRLNNIHWSGRLEEPAFLNRLYDLSKLPSTDSRFKDMESDIWQHRINNYDWEDDWVYSDTRLNLIRCSDKEFLAFLCEIFHPVVLKNETEANEYINNINLQLRNDGWEISAISQISGKPIFGARPVSSSSSRIIEKAKDVAQKLNSQYVDKQISRLENGIENDPDLAIGQAKEFAETVMKSILDDFGSKYSNNDNLAKLVKYVCENLEVAPENIPHSAKARKEIIKILRQLVTISQGMLEIRNAYGTGHGRSAKTTSLKARHARLAVHSVISVVEFLFDLYSEKKVNL